MLWLETNQKQMITQLSISSANEVEIFLISDQELGEAKRALYEC